MESGAVIPKEDCPHLSVVVQPAALCSRSTTIKSYSNCEECGEQFENWFCGTCHTVHCSRWKNAHAVSHSAELDHPIAVSLADLSAWCYQCESYVQSPTLDCIIGLVHLNKFGYEVSDPCPDAPLLVDHQAKEEIRDDPIVLRHKVQMLAEMVKKARHCVVYTGAGISTSAQLPDYRGPNGVYTKKGSLPEGTGVTLEQAVPTSCHKHLVKLLLRGLVKFIVSTNVDGLHQKSGVSGEMMAELHGNCFKEVCEECGLEYYREYAVSSHRKDHRTGRQCSCGGELRDTIINFGEKLPSTEWLKAATQANKSDLALVLGTSMWVQPANLLPEMAKSNEEGGNMVIVNLQETLFDEEADLVIHGEIDTVMEMLVELL